MKSKNLGRHELLSWINKIVQSDYLKIENLSDGVAYVQLIDAYFENIVDISKLKYWEKNFSILNDQLLKLKTHKQVDPIKMSQGKFTINFEFIQFLYDYLNKKFNSTLPAYKAFEKRISILRQQNGKNIEISKYLPSHLIVNDYILKKELIKAKEEEKEKENDSIKDFKIRESKTFLNVKEIEKFLFETKENLIEQNNVNQHTYSRINEIEEESEYYYNKLMNVLKVCEEKMKNQKNTKEEKSFLDNLIKVIQHVPEDFK